MPQVPKLHSYSILYLSTNSEKLQCLYGVSYDLKICWKY